MKLQDLKAMSPKQREAAIANLARASMGPANGQMGPLHARLRELEVRYEMSTQEMLALARKGELRDTADFSRWKVLARGLGG